MKGQPTTEKLKLKAKVYAKTYIKNKFNGTKTALELYDTTDRNVAHAIASENLHKPVFRNAIVEEMEKQGIDDEFINRIIKRNTEQDKNYSASNQAIDIALKVQGKYAPERKETKTISLNINTSDPKEVEQALTTLLKEIETLKTLGNTTQNQDVS